MLFKSWTKRAIVLLALGLVALENQGVWALIVTPGRTEIRLAPGEKVTFSITAQNDTPDNLDIQLAMRDWFVLPENKGMGVASWLEFKGTKEFTLKPGESQKVDLSAKCPKKAQGELVAMVSFICQTNPPSMITPVISVSVYLAAKGKEKAAGEISALDVGQFGNVLRTLVTVKSTGNIHLRPVGTITLLDSDGKVVNTLPIAEGSPAYPGGERSYAADTTALKLEPGAYSVSADLQAESLILKATRNFTVEKDGKIAMVKPIKK